MRLIFSAKPKALNTASHHLGTHKTNWMVERFNGRISEVVKRTRFASAAELERTLMNHQNTYNHHIPQRALNHLSPIEAPQDWRRKSRELFVKRVYKQVELDI